MSIPPFRIGQGYDCHALVPGRPLIVGGVKIPHTSGLLGHSDADVLLHAITDAILGAAGLGGSETRGEEQTADREQPTAVQELIEHSDDSGGILTASTMMPPGRLVNGISRRWVSLKEPGLPRPDRPTGCASN